MRYILLLIVWILSALVLHSQSISLQNPGSTLNVGDLDVDGDKITIEALIHVPADGSGINVLSKHTHTGNVNYLLRPMTFELTTYVSGNSGATKFLQMFNPYHLLPNQWYHIAGTYDGSSVKYYVNGCLVISTPWSGNLYQNDLITSIGNQSSCLCESYMGNIDEVRIWNVCRSQSEIATNMLSLPNPTTQTGLKAYYKFSGNYRNEQGDSRWDGQPNGPIAFSPEEAALKMFSISSVQVQNADCAKSPTGTITVSTTRPDAMFAVDGGAFQTDNTLRGLLPGKHRIYARTPEGCVLDSTVTLGDNQNFLRKTVSTTICQGQSWFGYTSSGIFIDTVQASMACDTIRTLNLTVLPLQRAAKTETICQGQAYQLPSGRTVTTAGVYQDTLHYKAGCDSLISTIELKLITPVNITRNIVVCPGENYTLPSGIIAAAAGTYRDTLHSRAGCDSVFREYTISYRKAVIATSAPVICSGDAYPLPWGATATSAGTYRDTIRYAAGCDSLIRIVTLTVRQKSLQATAAVICQGEFYTLPGGLAVTFAGTYRDTLRYKTGCDSVIRVVNLAVKTVTLNTTAAAICSGSSYTLPWGPVVSNSGIYRDTLRYRSGCDSLIKELRLTVTAPARISRTVSICSNEYYTLPWGQTVNRSGIYQDTVRTSNGCDSLVRQIRLQVNPVPAITLSKSNDVGCMLGTAKLLATGGVSYSWSPQASLDNAFTKNPTASPAATTIYKAIVRSAEGCTAEDSLEVKVVKGDPQKGYLVPNAFTPNDDGKNDCFGVPHWGAVTSFSFTVYNRYGEILFRTNDVSRCWDGTVKGKKQEPGAYVYLIKAQTLCGTVTRKGTVVLLQ